MKISRKILVVCSFIVMCMTSFAIKINSVDFNQEIPLKSSKTVEYQIDNIKTSPLKYTFSIENDKENSVQVSPKSFIILPNKNKKFKVKVTGKTPGEHKYVLKIHEELVDKNKVNGVALNFNYNIEQKYIVK